MKAVIYTRDDSEFDLICRLLSAKAAGFEIYRVPLDGHGHYSAYIDMAIVAVDGAEGMEIMLELTGRYPDARMIWITDDRNAAGMAIRTHICSFLVRPYTEEDISAAVSEAALKCMDNKTWHFAKRKKADSNV